MPELPEVETIRNKFRLGTDEIPSVVGKKITDVDLLWDRTLDTPTKEEFTRRLPGQTITDIGRRAKYLLFHLEADTLIIHLRMSGDLWYESAEDPVAPHHRMLLYLDNGHRLAFNDTRKFGRVWLLDDPDTLLAKIGPEPLNENFSAEDFYSRLQNHRRQLKPLLLDQHFIAGVGNIYADEALHRAGIHPQTRSHTISASLSDQLLKCLRAVLQEGIHRNGASIDWVYRGGDFQNYFQVYQRAGKPCYNCSTPIERISVGQRGTHFCPQCQPMVE